MNIVRTPTLTISLDFEQVLEEAESPDSRELANYEEYSRRELPRFFRSALEAAVNDEAQPIEERLKSRLVETIRDCQDRVFSAYRSAVASRMSPVLSSSMMQSSPSAPSSSCLRLQEEGTTSPHLEKPRREQSIGIVGTFYGETPLPTPQYLPSGFMMLERSFGAASQSVLSESSFIGSQRLPKFSDCLVTTDFTGSDVGTTSGSQTQSSDSSTSRSQPLVSGQPFAYSCEGGSKMNENSSESGYNLNFSSSFSIEDLCALFPHDPGEDSMDLQPMNF
jgi:hypothetical protein